MKVTVAISKTFEIETIGLTDDEIKETIWSEAYRLYTGGKWDDEIEEGQVIVACDYERFVD